MISGTSLTIGLLFLFLLSVDYPFRNRSGVSNQPLIELTSIFDKIDRFAEHARFSSAPAAPTSAPRE